MTPPDAQPEHPHPSQPQTPPAAPSSQGSLTKSCPFTLALLGALTAVFLVELIRTAHDSLFSVDVRTLLELGGLSRPLVLEEGQWWRMLTAPLLHGSAMHLVFNGFALLMAGAVLEPLIGRARTFALFVVGGLGGSVVSLCLLDESTVSVGASGAIMAMLAAVIGVAYALPTGASRDAIVGNTLRILVPSLLPFASSGHIDFGAHFGGAITGGAYALLLLVRRRLAPPPLSRAVAAACALALALAVAAALRAFPHLAQSESLVVDFPTWSAVSCRLHEPRACFISGLYLSHSGDKAAALSAYEFACEADVPEACHNAGVISPSEAHAAQLFQRACDLDMGDSCAAVAEAYRQGRGVTASQEKERAAAERACTLGTLPACARLGQELAFGDPPRQAAHALELLRKACTRGDEHACVFAANLLVLGDEGVPAKPEEGKALLERACTGEHTMGCNDLGLLYDSGEGVTKDVAVANGLFKRACDADDGFGCANLARNLEEAKATRDEVMALFERGCAHDSLGSCHDLAVRLADGVPPDYARALQLLEKACAGDIAEACNAQGWLLESGLGCKADLARAVELYVKACAHESAMGCRHLANLVLAGKGVAKDRARAIELYQKACAHEDEVSCGALTKLGVAR